MVATNFRRSCEAPGFRPTLVSAGQALATLARRVFSPVLPGSQATTSSPFARQREAQPLPMTPAPRMATVLISFAASKAMMRTSVAGLEAQLLATLGGSERAGAETGDDLAGALGQRAIRSMHALVEPDVVFQADPDVAAQEHRLRHH